MLASWILILTFATTGPAAGGAIHSVPGFTSESECMGAGAAWVRQNTGTIEGYSATWRPRALCVKQAGR